MNTLYILCGLPFSGKTTIANKISSHIHGSIVSFDVLMKANQKKLSLKKDPEGWQIIRLLAHKKIKELLPYTSVIYDDISMLHDHRNQLRTIAKASNAHALVVYLKTPLSVINDRKRVNNSTKERQENISENFELIVRQFEEPRESEEAFIITPEIGEKTIIMQLKDKLI